MLVRLSATNGAGGIFVQMFSPNRRHCMTDKGVDGRIILDGFLK